MATTSPAVTERRTGGFLSDSRPLRINPQAQPSDRQDGEYLDYGEVPQPGERPVTPLWEQVPAYGRGGNTGGGGFIGGGGGGGRSGGQVTATTRQVQANETVADQLNRLTRGDNAYIQGARQRADRGSSARGLLSSGMAMGNAERAAIDSALPIAAQDAAWYGRTAADNMDATNQAAIESANNATQLSSTSMSVNAGLRQAAMRNALEREQAAYDRNFRREQNIWDSEELGRQDYRREGINARSDYRGEGINARSDFRREGIDTRARRDDQNWQSSERQRERDYDWQSNRASFRESVIRDTFDTIRNNPEYFRDPEGAAGAMDFFTSEIDRIFNTNYSEVP